MTARTKLRMPSERELTTRAFKRDLKYLAFLFPAAIVLYWIAKHLGLLGQILGWVGVVIFAVLTLDNFISFLAGALVTGNTVFSKEEALTHTDFFWRTIAVLLFAGNALLYTAFTLSLCDALLGWKIIAPD